MNWIKKIFKKQKNIIHEITCGEKDENGFCYAYIDGKKTNIKMLVFTKEEIEKIYNAQENINS